MSSQNTKQTKQADLTPRYVAQFLASKIDWYRYVNTKPVNVIDPAAGHGALLQAVDEFTPRIVSTNLFACESRLDRFEYCRREGFYMAEVDVYNLSSRYDIIVANFPFENNEYEAMTLHSFRRLLVPGGQMFVVLPGNVRTREGEYAVKFQQWIIDRGGEWFDVPKENIYCEEALDCKKDLILLKLEKSE